MVHITEMKDDDPAAINDDIAAAMQNPAAGWVILAKQIRERGNACAAENDWGRAAKAYQMGLDNIEKLLNKNISDEEDEIPYVVKKSEEEIKNEGLYSDELKDLHLLLLKNLALAHTQTNELGAAIKAAGLALEIDPADTKALYRKAYALQKRGNEKDADEVKDLLKKIEELGLGDDSKQATEVKEGIAKIRKMAVQDQKKSKKLQKVMMSKPGAFSKDRQKKQKNYSPTLTPEERYKLNGETLSTEQAFAIVEKLAKGYESKEIQDKIDEIFKKRSCNNQDIEFRLRLADIAMIVQGPILEEYGFQPNKQGLTEMIAALYQHENDENEEGSELKPLLGMTFACLLRH